MSEYVYAGLTSQTLDIFLQDSSSSTGQGLSGLVFNSASLVASYRKGATGSRTAITLATQTVGGAWSSGGFVEIDATNMKGVYRLDIPNAAVDTEGFVTLYLYGATNLLPTALRIDCRPLPVDVKKYGGTAGTFASGIPSVNTTQFAGQAITAAAGVTIPASIASPTNITAGTITTATNVTTVNGLAAGVITASSIATNAIDADALATDAVTEINADVLSAISGIGTAGGAAVNTDATTDNASGGISGVTSATTKVGTQTGTFVNTSNVNSAYHQITHSGNAIDWVYQFLTGGGTSVVEARWTGYLDGSNDTITFYAWNHVGAAWESLGTQAGQAGTTNVVKNLTLYARHRGTSAAELGKVYIRLACTGQTSPILYTDQLFVSYAVTSRSVGYANGAVWIDTVSGVAGTESFVNGVADNPVLTLADALTIATAVNLRNFEIDNGSTITLASTTANKVFNGHEWTLALGGQNIASSMFIDASVSGTASGSAAEFDTCEIQTASLADSNFHHCAFNATLTLNAAGDYMFADCYSHVSGTGSPVFDFTGAGTKTASFRRWSGGMTLNNISSSHTISIDVVSGGTITLNGADGNVQVRGMCSSIVDNRTGSPTLGKNAVINQTLIATPTNITAGTIATVTTLTGHTPQTGDSFARIGALGAGLTSLAPAATALSTAVWTATIANRIDVAVSTRLAPLVAGRDLSVAATTGAVELDSATALKINRIEAVATGTVTGAGTSTEVFVGPSATLTITVDSSGNRSAVVVT